MSMFFGILKMFSKKSYLDDFMNGHMYCNTPHFYRSTDQLGVGDSRESCIISHYNDENVEITLNGYKLNSKELQLVMRNSNEKESWLHCWYMLTLPDDITKQEEIEKYMETLQKELEVIKSEFGFENYVFIEYKNIKEFIKRITEASTKHNVRVAPIKYVENENDIGVFSKYHTFKYQSEFRIAIGECDSFSEKPLIFNVDNGFHDIAIVNPEIKLKICDTSILIT